MDTDGAPGALISEIRVQRCASVIQLYLKTTASAGGYRHPRPA